jgi:hypothetical protein
VHPVRADAEAVGAEGEGTVQVAVIVRVGGGVGLVDRDRRGVDVTNQGTIAIGNSNGASAWMPIAPLLLPIAMVPWLVTAWLLSIVTAVPEVGRTEPAEVMVIASGAPAFTVEVRTGWVMAVAMFSATAGVANARIAVLASRRRYMRSPHRSVSILRTEPERRSLGAGL